MTREEYFEKRCERLKDALLLRSNFFRMTDLTFLDWMKDRDILTEEDVAYIKGCAELIIDDPEEDEKIIDICEDLFVECDSTQQKVIINYYHDTIQKQLGTGVVVLPDGCRLAER